ncbi:chaplin [Nonomuraea pusilla]|uniref:Small secreted domain n=1 Tax=Nonomuraea pusilla TaxID=46177 RepID=A0A1H8CUT2_9ACTN|nr:chaplin [Nonomuraea pusilla]SEM98746.1 Small secreted domain [Nonomuraea pusilla]
MLKKIMVIAGAAAALSFATPALADDTSGDGGVLSGNQLFVPISAPINVCGNSLAILGVAVSGCKGGSYAAWHRH